MIFCDLNYYYKVPTQVLTDKTSPPVQLLLTDIIELPHLGNLCLVLSKGQLQEQQGWETQTEQAADRSAAPQPSVFALSGLGIVPHVNENFPIVPL